MTTVRIVDASNQLSELVDRAADERELIILTSEGKPKAILLGVEAFETLVGMHEYANRQLIPLDSFQQQFQQALIEAGYDSHQKIVNLVQEIKQEIAAERQQKSVTSAESKSSEGV
jgi:prevent-host-death family protein